MIQVRKQRTFPRKKWKFIQCSTSQQIQKDLHQWVHWRFLESVWWEILNPWLAGSLKRKLSWCSGYKQEIEIISQGLTERWPCAGKWIDMCQYKTSQCKNVKVVRRLQWKQGQIDAGHFFVMETNKSHPRMCGKNYMRAPRARTLALFSPSVFVTSVTTPPYLYHCLTLLFSFHSQHQDLSYPDWITVISSPVDFPVWADAVISQIVICYNQKIRYSLWNTLW